MIYETDNKMLNRIYEIALISNLFYERAESVKWNDYLRQEHLELYKLWP